MKSPFSAPKTGPAIEQNTPDKKMMPATKVLGRILKFMKPYAGFLVLGLILTVGQVVAELFIPFIIKDAVNAFQISVVFGAAPQVDGGAVLRAVLMIAGLTGIAFLCNFFGTLCTNKVSLQTIRDVRISAFKKLNRVPLSYIDNNSNGDLMNRISNDADQVSDGLIQGFTQIFTGVITVIAAMVYLIILNYIIALAVIIITPLSLGIAWLLAKKTVNLHKRRSEKNGELAGLCEEYIGNQKIINAFSHEAEAEEKFDVINQEIKKVGTLGIFLSSITNPVARFLNGIIYAVAAVIGALFVIGGSFLVGDLTAILLYTNKYSKPFNEITGIIAELQTAFSSARRVFAIIDEKEESDDSALPELGTAEGKIDAKEVRFSYVPEKPLIKNFNLSVNPGQKIAIVGPTGCGKTTLINLLMRFYDVNSGAILIDGQNITKIKRNSYRRNYGMVLQETWLFDGTVHDNIAYGNPDATRDEVIAAARAAKCNGFIKRLENGYDTFLTDNGGSLSAGQKQLICIARIMLTRPPMLILDEATSSIDTRTEKRIQIAFDRIMEGRTCFIIAHRLSTITDADKILVMNEGDIIESGTHKELIEKGGFYAELHNSQFVVY